MTKGHLDMKTYVSKLIHIYIRVDAYRLKSSPKFSAIAWVTGTRFFMSIWKAGTKKVTFEEIICPNS
jgi:hypothetical protein